MNRGQGSPVVTAARGSEVAHPHAGDGARAARGAESASQPLAPGHCRQSLRPATPPAGNGRGGAPSGSVRIARTGAGPRSKPAAPGAAIANIGRSSARLRGWEITAAWWFARNTKAKWLRPFFTSPAGSLRSGIYETASKKTYEFRPLASMSAVGREESAHAISLTGSHHSPGCHFVSSIQRLIQLGQHFLRRVGDKGERISNLPRCFSPNVPSQLHHRGQWMVRLIGFCKSLRKYCAKAIWVTNGVNSLGATGRFSG